MLCGIFATLTFTFGVGVSFFEHRLFPTTVSLCDIARDPDWYDGKSVRVQASASAFYGSVLISDMKCFGKEHTSVVMDIHNIAVSPEVGAFIDDSKPEIHDADILVIGRFDQNATPGCFGPRFGIHAVSVELRSAVKVKVWPEKK
jgi:hypothetical protein